VLQSLKSMVARLDYMMACLLAIMKGHMLEMK